MARPTAISQEQILEAARTVFLKSGINATTKEIARTAGIAESTLFYRFPTKEALFRAAMADPPLPAWVEELEQLVGVGDMRANLLHIGRELIVFSRQIMPMFMLAFGDNPGLPATEIKPGKQMALQSRERLTLYLQQEISLGRFRDCDAEVASKVLFGSCVGFVVDSLTLNQPHTEAETEDFVTRLVDVLWGGFAPQRG